MGFRTKGSLVRTPAGAHFVVALSKSHLPCLVLAEPRKRWTDCDKAGDYVVPNVLSPRDLVFRPDNMDETVLHTENSVNPDQIALRFWNNSLYSKIHNSNENQNRKISTHLVILGLVSPGPVI